MKCRPIEVPVAAVELAACAKEGKQYNWCLYLLNQFMEDCISAQEHNQLFHYSWLLVLIAFVTWKESKNSEFIPVQNDYRGVRYVNLWAIAHPDKQCLNNIVFYTYYQQPCALITDRVKDNKAGYKPIHQEGQVCCGHTQNLHQAVWSEEDRLVHQSVSYGTNGH